MNPLNPLTNPRTPADALAIAKAAIAAEPVPTSLKRIRDQFNVVWVRNAAAADLVERLSQKDVAA